VWFSFRTSVVSELCYRTLVPYLAFIVIDKPLTVTSIILLRYFFSGFYNSYSTAKSVILISEGLVNETAVMRRHAASNAFHVSLSHYWQARAGSASFHPRRIACFLKDGRTGLDKVFNHQSFCVRAVDLLHVFNLQWRQTRAGTTVKERKD
jgi:hypothetical protein